jgi:cytochrome b subunit of formate dehydrogenase
VTILRRALGRRLLSAASVLGVAAFLGVAALPAAATGPTGRVVDATTLNDQCFTCHGQKGANIYIDVAGKKVSQYITVNGQRKSLYVDEAKHKASPHGELACISCHIGFNAGMHSPQVTQNWLQTAKIAACRNCHANTYVAYTSSFHGQLALQRHDSKAPLCADCHNAHDILVPGTPAFRESVMYLCMRCHGGRETTYLDSYHGKAFLLGNTKTAVCTGCHYGHKIEPKANPSSTVSKQRVLATCRRCHPGATQKFAGFRVHVNPKDPRSSVLIFSFWAIYVALITVVFGFAAAHTTLYIYRARKDGLYHWRHRGAADRRGKTRVEYQRFNVFHRWMHFLVFVSFTILVFTGMPLKYKDTAWAQWFMDLFGGVTAAGVYHRIAALFTVFYWSAEMLYMIVAVARSRGTKLRGPDSMMPRMKDLHDIIGMFGWFLGKGPKPQFDRYAYWEKFDYLALAAGTVIIGATGFMMWFPLKTTEYLPGIVLNIALVIHSNEALLAMGVIFIFVHFFSAHLRPESFPGDKVIFTGSLPVDHYQAERPLEYARRVREGTLDDVLIEKTITSRTLLANGIWWLITAVAGIAALLMTAFIVWSVVS